MSKVVRLFSLISLISQLLFSDFAFFPINFQIGGITHLISKTWDVWEQLQQKKKMLPKESKRRQIPLFQTKRIIHQYLTRRACKWSVFLMSEVSREKVFDKPYNLVCPPLFLIHYCWMYSIQSIGKVSKLPTFKKEWQRGQTKSKKSLPCQKTIIY